METLQTLDVTKIEPRLKHPTIFKYFDALQPGEAFVIENDHDPKPLYYELIGERGNIFTWEYLQQGPEEFVVQITKNPAESPKKEIERLNVTAIEPRLKHPTIFKYFDALKPGEVFIIENDHDPKPLYYELIGERGNIFTWEYLQQGQEEFVVQITKNATGDGPTQSRMISEKDVKKAELLKAKGVDFSCNENKKQNSSTPKSAAAFSHDYANCELTELTDYILTRHHKYIRENAENLNDLAIKVSEHHGDGHPELNRIATITYHFLQDLLDHMVKEENVLFPVIDQVVSKTKDAGMETTYRVGTLHEPIDLLTKEHAVALADLSFIRRLTNDYTPPAEACNSYRYLFRKLEEFEREVHTMLGLENNYLFPRAVAQDRLLAEA